MNLIINRMPLMGSFFITHVPPIIYYLSAFILGISLHIYSVFLIPLFLGIGALLFFKYHQRALSLICISVVFGSLTHNGYNYLYEKAAETIPKEPTAITGVITDIQRTNHHLFKNLIVVSLNTINEKPVSWFNPHNKILIYVSSYPSVEVDDTVTLENIVCKKPAPSSYRGHLMREQTIATVFTPKITPTHVSKPTYSYRRWIYNTKILVTKRATQSLLPVTKSLYASLFLGNKTYVSSCYESIKEQFRRWGLSHYLARSGLHLVLIVALWAWFFRMIPVPFIYKQLGIAFLVMIYALLSWSSISFIRALSTFFLCKLCSSIWHHYYNNLHLLTITAFYLLLQNPLHIFYLDFQLSFGITFALAWLHLLKTYQSRIELKTIASI
jgi:competence protein ComEC